MGWLILAVIVTCCASEANPSEYGISTYRPGMMDLFSGFLANPAASIVKDYFIFHKTSADATTPKGELTAKVTHHHIHQRPSPRRAHDPVSPARRVLRVRCDRTEENRGSIAQIRSEPTLRSRSETDDRRPRRPRAAAQDAFVETRQLPYDGSTLQFTRRPANTTWMEPETGRHCRSSPATRSTPENTATHYHSGQEFHADFVAAQHLPMGFIFGAAGYALQQTTADSGSGAIFGPYEGRVLALGPLVGKAFSAVRFRSR